MAKRSISQNPPPAYVYEIVVDGVVRYIGKGIRSRMKVHMRIAAAINRDRELGQKVKALKVHNRLAKAIRKGAAIEVRKIADGLASKEALDREIAEIASHPEGRLWNDTLGGEGLDPETARKLWSKPEHRAKMKAIHSDPERIARQRENTHRQFSDPEQRAKAAEKSRALWADPEFRKGAEDRLRAVFTNPETRARHKAVMVAAYKDPALRAVRSEISRAHSSKPETKEHMRLVMNDMWARPEVRAKFTAQWTDPDKIKARAEKLTPEFLKRRGEAISKGLRKSDRMKQVYSDPDVISRRTANVHKYWSNPEARAAHSAKMKTLWRDPEHIAKTTAHWAAKRKVVRDDKA